ncbi:MAG: hypothetical protein K0S26_905 [Bacteroidota bacterium]|jgi:hypothetical protein|nr:hypothetical protein [Bacteroidota bacterium]
MGRKLQIIKHIEEEGSYRVEKQGTVLKVFKKPGVSGQQFLAENRFVNTRLHNMDFKACAAAGKLLREQLLPLLQDVKNRETVRRVLQVMLAIQDMDASPRGYKRLTSVYETDAAKGLLTGFNFSGGQRLDTLVLKKPLITKAGICFKDFVATTDLRLPEGATHAELRGGCIQLNLAEDYGVSEFSKPVRVVLNERVRQVKLSMRADDSVGGLCLYVLKLRFFRNGLGMRGDGQCAVAIVQVV